MALITCKECKQQVSDTAEKCPHCGAKVPKKTSALTAIVTIVIAFFVWAGMSGGDKKPSSSASARSEQTVLPPISVTAVELARAYDRNEAAGDSAYKGRTLSVTGTITGITKDFKDDTVVNLQGVNMFSDVQAELQKSQESRAVTLRKGQMVTVQCLGAGEVVSMPMLNDCTIQ